MIVVKKMSWWRILLRYRGTALERTKTRIILTTLVAGVVTYAHETEGLFHDDLTPLPFSLSGLALSIFLGFRNNTSYDRFWEGRKLWGRMVNVSRSCTRQIITMIGPMPGEHDEPAHLQVIVDPDLGELRAFHRELVHRIAAYVHCFRMHLRDRFDPTVLEGLISDEEIKALENESNRPIAMLQTMGDRFRLAWRAGWIHAMHFPVLEGSLTEMAGIQGGCERIKNTPIPFSYTALIHRIVAIYCYALPFGLVAQTKALTPIVVAIISYAFFGLDAVGDEIEDPFGTDDNDLPLEGLSTMIEKNIRQRVGDDRLPLSIVPRHDIVN